MRAVIFANGDLRNPQIIRDRVKPGDLKIAADGGTHHYIQLGWKPDIIVGDFDSLSPEVLESLRSDGVEIVRHPARKDFTDLELALRYSVEHGAEEIDIFAAVGSRLDQSLANLLLLSSERFRNLRVRLFEANQEVLVIAGGNPQELHGRPGETVSLIPLLGDARGISTEGLEYPLRGETLRFGETRGISNLLLDRTAVVQLEDGLLLCVILHAEEPDEA